MVFCGIKSNFIEILIIYIMLLKTQKKVVEFIVLKYTSSEKNAFKRMKYCGDVKNYIEK